MICFDTLPPECLLHGYMPILIMQPDKKMHFPMENFIPDTVCLHFQSAGAQVCLTEDAGAGGGVPPVSGSPAERGPGCSLEMLPHARLAQDQGKGQRRSSSCLRHLTSGKAFPWVIKHLCMGLETVTVSAHYNYG